MNESPNRTIDAQIKELLARAIADSPPPPDLERPMLTKTPDADTSNRNPWFVIGGVGLAAAATVAGLLIIPNMNDQTTVVAPSNTALPEVTSAVSVLPEVETPASTSPEVMAPASTALASPTAPPSMVVSAGSNGIEVLPLEEVGQIVTTEPAKLAVVGPDGRIYFQPAETNDSTNPDTRPRVVDIATGDVSTVDVPADADQSITLMDVEAVGGQLTILYSSSYNSCSSGADPACVTTLRTFQPNTGAAQILAERNTWEFGWQPFTLASNGIVAGAGSESVVEEPTFFNMAGGVVPTLGALGLDDGYADCVDCPTAFAVDADGAHVAWFDGAAGDRRIVITELATGARADVGVAAVDRPGYLQLAGVRIVDGAIVSGQAVYTPFAENGSAAPVLVDLATGGQQDLTPGTIASLS